MRAARRFGSSCLLFGCAFFAVSAPSSAKPKAIKGKLSDPDYTVIALTGDGRATSDRAENRAFRLPTVSGKVSLHLRAPDGTYAGPIVAGGGRKRAIMGVEDGVALGKVAVRDDHGEVAKRLSQGRLDARRTAKAKKGVPIGAGNFGLVRSQPPRHAPLDDPDIDGIPDVFDVDDDGDRVLDGQDRRGPPRSALRGEPGTDPPDPEIFGVGARLEVPLEATANANPRSATDPQQPAFTDAQIEGALPLFGTLGLSILPGQFPELDCGGAIQEPPRPVGLVYCRPHSAGGIGQIPPLTPGGPFQPFPDCCDSGFPGDPDGNGTLAPSGPPATCEGCPPGGVMGLRHRASPRDPALDPADPATPEGIGTGDVLIQRVTRGGTEIGFINTLGQVFATVPALASYNDGAGLKQVSYPVVGSNPGPADPGTRQNGFQVTDDPSPAETDTDIEVELTYWRLQRRAVPPWGEPPGWIDIGLLDYEVPVGETGGRCPNEAFSALGDDLRPDDPEDEQASGFTDLRENRVADPGNTFTFTLNLSECFRANGISFTPDDPARAIGLRAAVFAGADPVAFAVASQTVFFKAQ